MQLTHNPEAMACLVWPHTPNSLTYSANTGQECLLHMRDPHQFFSVFQWFLNNDHNVTIDAWKLGLNGLLIPYAKI